MYVSSSDSEESYATFLTIHISQINLYIQLDRLDIGISNLYDYLSY